MPYELTGSTVTLVVEPHSQTIIAVESVHGKFLGAATPLDRLANNHRRRAQPTTGGTLPRGSNLNLVELTLQQQQHRRAIPAPEVA